MKEHGPAIFGGEDLRMAGHAHPSEADISDAVGENRLLKTARGTRDRGQGRRSILDGLRGSRSPARVAKALAIVVVMASLVLLTASCGRAEEQGSPARDEQKYPPGTTGEMLAETTGSGSLAPLAEGGDGGEGTEKAANAPAEGEVERPGATVELAGVRFTVVEARRRDSNDTVLSAGQPEVPGDYLEVEILAENVSDGVVDLSGFSFRLWSPGIDADAYEGYYGADPRFGRYVSDNMVSLVLLDYATLQPASRKLKAGETLEGAFLFCDLNPSSVARNQGVAKDNANLVVRKLRGDEAGEEAEISLAGYPD